VKIAMVSDHASPMTQLGGVDAGGQNVHVADLSAAMARRAHHVSRRPAEELGTVPTVGEPVVCPSTESFRP
jgi:D-inositol-3-phosphate glycosyltransferase